MSLADIISYFIVIIAIVGFGITVWNYVKGLKQSPRDLWLLFIYKIVEYAAYAAMNMSFILWLSKDCGLGDVAAGSFISTWSIMLSVMGMIAGALIDTIGIKKTLKISILFLLISRIFMTFVTNPYLVFILGFIPLTIGFAIVAPLVSVAIKRYTTKEGAAMGFGLFYVLMNVGYAIGGFFFDWIRGEFGLKDAVTGKVIDENAGTILFGHHFSTYQLIFIVGVVATIISYIMALLFRDGVELQDNGEIVITPTVQKGSGLEAIKHAAKETAAKISLVIKEKYFWVFIGLLTLTIPVRSIFFHFHYTFPKYGIRVLGEGAKIGSIYGVLNPVLIIFLVPLVASMTKKVSSYKMMLVGSTVSTLSCFIAMLPESWFSSLTNSVWGELLFIKWLRMSPDMMTLMQNPPTSAYWPLVFFIFIFTIGEAIWSPRLMQFTAEIAPKGKEGTYVALAVLPFFFAKFIVGPMSGFLVQTYTPLDPVSQKALSSYPNHWMVWVWVGGMALISPIGLVLFKKAFEHPDVKA